MRGLPLPVYEVVRTEGEIHAQTFWVRCEVSTLGFAATGSGPEPAARRAGGGGRGIA